jgi:hypothetical protein
MKYLLLLFLLTYSCAEKTNYLIEYNKQSRLTQHDILQEYDKFKKIYDDIFQWYIKNIKLKWPKVELNHKHIFVKYQKDFSQKYFIDFRNGIIKLSTMSKNEKEAAHDISQMFLDLMTFDVESLVKTNIILNQIAIEQKVPLTLPQNKTLLVGDLFSKTKQKEISNSYLEKTFDTEQFNETTIYSTRLMLPEAYKIKRESLYKGIVEKYTTKLPKAIFYTLMKIESGFNLISTDNTMGFGLLNMEYGEKTISSYYKINGRYSLLPVSMLFEFETNLLYASKVLEEIYFYDLKELRNTDTKKLLTSFIYKYGFKELFKAYKVDDLKGLITKLNESNSKLIYKHLMKKFKSRDVKNYLFRLQQGLKDYEK